MGYSTSMSTHLEHHPCGDARQGACAAPLLHTPETMRGPTLLAAMKQRLGCAITPSEPSFVPLDPYGVYFLIPCQLSCEAPMPRLRVRECYHAVMAWMESAGASPPGGP